MALGHWACSQREERAKRRLSSLGKNQSYGNEIGSLFELQSHDRLLANDFQRERAGVGFLTEPADLPDPRHAMAVHLQQEVTGLQSGTGGGGA